MPAFNPHAYDAAWRWFETHARQRMELFRFYASIFIALLAGVGALWTFERPGEALALSLIGVVFVSIFQGMDRRTADLVHRAEEALEIEQARLKEECGYDEIEIARRADEVRQGRSYGASMRMMSSIMTLVFALAAGLSAYPLLAPHISAFAGGAAP